LSASSDAPVPVALPEPFERNRLIRQVIGFRHASIKVDGGEERCGIIHSAKRVEDPPLATAQSAFQSRTQRVAFRRALCDALKKGPRAGGGTAVRRREALCKSCRPIALRHAARTALAESAITDVYSACQVHPFIAQTWSGRLKSPIVMAANFGYRPGWVHFAARTGQDAYIPTFLATVRPPGADEQYGKGSPLATGGALRIRRLEHISPHFGVRT
jgi:hypothetical protein